MSRQVSSPPVSPSTLIDSEQNIATISRHDSINSAQDLEVAELRRQIEKLQATETSLIWQCDEASRELKTCKSDLAKEKQEARTFAGKLSKESRNLGALNDDMVTLRKDTERQICDIESKLDQERKKRAKIQQDADRTITGLRSELDAKQSVIKNLQACIPDKKRHLHVEQAKIGATRATAYCPTSSLACMPSTHDANPYQPSPVSHLQDTIKYLQKENARLQNMHHEDGCEEHRNFIFHQLEDAKGLQAAAEAETEGLRHIAKVNADLIEENVNNLSSFKENAKEPLAKEHFTSGMIKDADANHYLNQLLGFSAITYLDTVPVAPEDNEVEIAEYIHRLRAAELEIEVLSSDRNVPPEPCTPVYPASAALGLSTVFCLASEPEAASLIRSSLKFSDLQTVSTTPRTPVPTTNPLNNPALLAGLEDLGNSIMSLSTVPSFNGMVQSSTELQVTPLPNVALTINIQPTDKRNYSLLQRVQSAISATSSLDIHGPKESVKQLVASMHDVEADHAEKSKLVVQLEMVSKQYLADIDVLEAQIRDKRKCLDPEHRIMADELEAKNVQFAMQEQLLADWGRRTE
ncbi:hypothetical protein AA0114_g10096 [Alternaria tenuissima]|uniref:Uncharacterized protein n=1 Tax=Alternaria tenuissima TaxID=119927 RepID=A0A4Q4M4T6_9PLEO|nr:hypothetical protein AA0114_g10096 [Alternaria tenuissima]